MKMRHVSTLLMLVGAVAVGAQAQVSVQTTAGTDFADVVAQVKTNDLIQGVDENNGLVQTGGVTMCSVGASCLRGFHVIINSPADAFVRLTDGFAGAGMNEWTLFADNYERGSYTGASGRPVNVFQYNFANPTNIGQIDVYTGNEGNRDGRVFHTYQVQFSTDGTTFSAPIYVQSHPYRTINREAGKAEIPGFNNISVNWVKTALYNASTPHVATGVRAVRFTFYSSTHGWSTPGGGGYGWFSDPYEGVNPVTNVDDQIPAPDGSPVVFEIDILAQKTVVSAIPGDTDMSGCVDDADLTNMILDFGAAGGSSSGFAGTDVNNDGVVDDADLTDLILAFGNGC